MACHSYCQCDDCRERIVNQFKAFDYAYKNKSANHNKIIGYQMCPVCHQNILSKDVGGFIIWYCWRCQMKEGVIRKLLPNHGYGFAETKDNKNIYFNFDRVATIETDYNNQTDLIVYQIKDDAQAIIDRLKIGDTIMFQEIIGVKGTKALWFIVKE